MTDDLLVPFDGSLLSKRAVEYVAEKHPDAAVTILHVVDPIGVVYEAEAHGLADAETWHERATEAAERACADAAKIAADVGCDVTTAVETGRPARVILEYVEDHDIDHVVMGSHGRSGASRLLLGSTAERVVRRSPVPVTVVR
ncbi:universal stress protein [Halorussus lipolyticus]|uniref:universal stress protein n=1 Tax=Halorussus lipolyticus TaxID=3034024 RepID=UPI0023E79C4E|nr:universal stress protein [Halorussus sp. DT80]